MSGASVSKHEAPIGGRRILRDGAARLLRMRAEGDVSVAIVSRRDRGEGFFQPSARHVCYGRGHGHGDRS